MTFREGCFVIHVECRYLSEAPETFKTISFTKESFIKDNISQLDDDDVPFSEQQYTHGSYYISLFKFKSFDQFNPLNCFKF